MNGWSELQFQTANQFIHQQVRRYGHPMEEPECIQESWRAFLTAKRSYVQVAGCCSFTVYAQRCIWESLEILRHRRNRCICLESNLSLDRKCKDGDENIGERFFSKKTGDFSNGVALWDFAQRQGELKYHILRRLYDGWEDWEIIEDECLPPEIYYALLNELQEAFEEWLML